MGPNLTRKAKSRKYLHTQRIHTSPMMVESQPSSSLLVLGGALCSLCTMAVSVKVRWSATAPPPPLSLPSSTSHRSSRFPFRFSRSLPRTRTAVRRCASPERVPVTATLASGACTCLGQHSPPILPLHAQVYFVIYIKSVYFFFFFFFFSFASWSFAVITSSVPFPCDS